jgi:hypothetical protein
MNAYPDPLLLSKMSKSRIQVYNKSNVYAKRSVVWIGFMNSVASCVPEGKEFGKL